MHVRSSIAVITPEPMKRPFCESEVTSSRVSIWSAVITGKDEPPTITALSCRPFAIPPPRSSIRWRTVMPCGASYAPGRTTLPDRQKTRVPVESGGAPICAYSSGPSSNTFAMFVIVSTLLISVGERYKPSIAGNGGFERGWPRLPSSDSSSAVSSPQMYAPAPRWIVSSASPSRPAARASPSAALSTSYSVEYSPRM